MGHVLPAFSVVIPTYARLMSLTACLQSLASLDYPGDRFEVIVVDDGSERPPEDLVNSFCGSLDVTLLLQPHAGPAAARNAGAARANGDFLAFTDDDCAPARDWLKALAARIAAAPAYAVGGQTLNSLLENVYSTASQQLIAYLYRYYNSQPGEARFFASNNLAVPARLFHAIGGFDTSFPNAAAEDRDFCDRWRFHGYQMVYAPEVLVHHSHSLTLRTFWRQHFKYGCGAYHFRRARARCGGGRMRVEPVSFYLNLLRYPLLQVPGWRGLSIATLLIVSQVANTAGFVWESTAQAAATRGRW